jgi:hypothetical protein
MSMIRYKNACDILHLCFKIVTCLVYNFDNHVRYSMTITSLKPHILSQRRRFELTDNTCVVTLRRSHSQSDPAKWPGRRWLIYFRGVHPGSLKLPIRVCQPAVLES